jgi:SAM-dependent methyltransferase
LELHELQRNWDEFGRTDPLGAILGGHGEEWDRREFFSTGVREIHGVLRYVGSLGIPLFRRRAMDFGCGVGRLTQALCRHFDECWGIDIAPSMIDLARNYNRYGDRCKYHLNQTDNLRAFEDESWDFIYSNLVLQHMKPAFGKNYIKEFLRVLSPNGVLVFQLPAELKNAPGSLAVVEEALPDTAFRAYIKPHQSIFTGRPASQIKLIATVQNLSSVTWPSARALPHCPIKLGNHWLNGNGELLRRDDGRHSLDDDLKPMEETELQLVISTPPEPGHYIVGLDMVQEYVAWFGDKGSEIAKIKAEVNGNCPTSPFGQASGILEPRMELYGIPKEEALEIIASAGGQILHVKPDFSAGVEWTSFCYCVTK